MTKFVGQLQILSEVFQGVTVVRVIVEEPYSRIRGHFYCHRRNPPSSNASHLYLADTRLGSWSVHRPS
jgi:hypothetical protein